MNKEIVYEEISQNFKEFVKRKFILNLKRIF